MKSKYLFVAEIGHSLPPKVYEIKRSTLVEIAEHKVLQDCSDHCSDDELIEVYFKQNNHRTIVEENFLDFVESILCYSGHQERELRKAFDRSFGDLYRWEELIGVLNDLIHNDRITGDKSQVLVESWEREYVFRGVTFKILEPHISPIYSETPFSGEVRERTDKTISVQCWQMNPSE